MATGIVTDAKGGAECGIWLSIEDARMLTSALGDWPDGESLHPGWGPKAQAKLTLAMNRLRAAVLDNARLEIMAHNAAALARRLGREAG